MSDTESHAAAPHPETGGKSLAAAAVGGSLERRPYQSYRKKYRKLRHKFDGVLEENKKLFKEEQKMQGTARRLREELDSILDVLLDLNQNPALPAHLRFDVSLTEEHSAIASIPSVVPADITPTAANDLLMEYTVAVNRGQIPHLDLYVIREQIDKTLAKQGLASLESLEESVSHARPTPDSPANFQPDFASSYLTAQEEDESLLRLDAAIGDPVAQVKEKEQADDVKHWADLTPREIERQTELQNPQSQHNWLKTHAKQSGPTADIDDNDSIDAKPARGAGAKRNLAKQVGDRSLGRAREGASPAGSFGDDDELSGFVDDHPKKRGRDPGSTYRIKGGKSNGANGKGKRKRSDETPSGSAKKARTEEE
ncbi:putative INO80 complex subunit 3 protein [Septoria linicola]|nr:putative INO80 complex subunit 3 protein [Septoria linicola]